MKKLCILVLSLSIILSMSGCGAFIQGFKDGYNAAEQEANKQTETPVENPSDNDTNKGTDDLSGGVVENLVQNSIEEEMQKFVNSFLNANISGTGIVDYIGVFNSDYEYVKYNRYYDDALLCKAMLKDSTFTNVSKANSLTVESVESISRGIYSVSLKNDLGTSFTLVVHKYNDTYLVDASRLFVPAKLQITNGVEGYLNGILLSEDDFDCVDGDGYRIYNISYLLANVENTMKYATGFSSDYESVFVVDAKNTDIKLVYTLTADDYAVILPKVAELWNTLHTAAQSKDVAGVSKLLTDDSVLNANLIIDGHDFSSPVLTLKQFEKRADTDSFLRSTTRIALNLRGSFVGEYSYGTKSPTKFNYVLIEIQEDGSYKIYDASTPIWIEADINAYSDD